MNSSLHVFDWLVIAIYLVSLMAFAIYLSRSQETREDYYVGGRTMGAWPVAISIMATQCSTNSILGAPAFVAFAAGGGLVWLQYELALPLAMIVLMVFFMPLFRSLKLVSVYEYLELRFDRTTRLVLSGLFLFLRAFATAVTVYSISIVIDLITGIGFFWSVVILGLFTVIYDVIGGIKGVVYSDVIQMFILVIVLLLIFAVLLVDIGGFGSMMSQLSPDRKMAINFSDHGLGDGKTFAFWPMLIGGFFLYVSYYGCDQSQVQRELCTKDIRATHNSLLINGLLRFPLVALYCFVGVGIAVYAANQGDFVSSLPSSNGVPNYNLAVPQYIITHLPIGVVGLAMVALFAAAMSSLDSVLNSLSAITIEDFIRPNMQRSQRLQELFAQHEIYFSRVATVVWGVSTLVMAFFVDDIAPTVLEAINKIGSLALGPILAVFSLGIFTRVCTSRAAIVGLFAGVILNAWLWKFAPNVSWLWWNASGFMTCVFVALIISYLTKPALARVQTTVSENPKVLYFDQLKIGSPWVQISVLLLWFLILLVFLSSFN